MDLSLSLGFSQSGVCGRAWEQVLIWEVIPASLKTRSAGREEMVRGRVVEAAAVSHGGSVLPGLPRNAENASQGVPHQRTECWHVHLLALSLLVEDGSVGLNPSAFLD